MICNSLDIDFIHGDIQGRSCKKLYVLDDKVGHRYNAVQCNVISHTALQWLKQNTNQMILDVYFGFVVIMCKFLYFAKF